MGNGDRDLNIATIVKEALDIIESEHGLAGLDHVLEIVQARRNSIVFSLEEQRGMADT